MGYKSTQAVLEGLFGRELTVDRIDAKTGKKSIRRLTAQDMALLLTVAARQNDPFVVPDDSDPIWYASEEKVCNFVHFKKSSLYESRNFLVKLGLLRYSRSKRHMNYGEPSTTRVYHNVYQVGIEKLSSLADRKVRNADPTLPKSDSKVRNTETHTDSTDTKQQTNRQSLSGKDGDYLRRVLDAIADSLGIDATSIFPNVIAEAIRGKFPDSVFNAIHDPNGWFRSAKVPLNALVSVLRKLPLQANDPDYRRQHQPTTAQILDNVSDDIRCLANDAIRNTGFAAATFVQQLIPLLQRQLCTPAGREFAVETIHRHKAKGAEDSQLAARQILRALAARQGRGE